MNDNLLQTTLRMLRETDASPQTISRDTGLKLRWLHRLKAGDFEDPGVTKIERLYRYLKGRAPPDRTTADGSGADGGAICQPQSADAGHRRETTNDGERGEEVDAAA